MVSLPFRTLREVLFQWPPQCPTISICPLISLALSPDQSIDLIESTISLFLYISLSFARSLSDFSIDYSVRVYESRSLFYLFTRSFFRAEALYGTTGDLRETRSYFAIVFLSFCFCAFGYFLSHSNRTQHNGQIVQSADFPAPLYAVRLLVVRRLSRCFERVHPFNFAHFAFGVPPTWIFPFLV